ncbi:autotransporter-associated beta strand repeat-containing protein [Methylobacterium sp. NEAU 140]|uniref:beta strand repeat-containing protein n=1 Tax=Methylobacterium sp. NEAU 140 TaxID=3064945 RepID=UPI002734614F|nr:autotransporter-associated beta strand repeat-containing protein [Methylobacterium sp. NEAU 140]MDP4022101.1 autotransporter-associated beta strand repeat-containing protein [Methylobacterium sp. NEAU 140]
MTLGIGGTGGTGVFLAGPGTFTNTGTGRVAGGTGGTGGGAGGIGFAALAGGTLINLGTITGGAGGTGATGIAGVGTTSGGVGGQGGTGGIGALVAGSGASSNAGTIAGGVGGAGGAGGAGATGGSAGTGNGPGGPGGNGGVGGVGLQFSGPGSFTNSGAIVGGQGGAAGAAGAAGASGAAPAAPGFGGTGGTGVVLAGPGTFVNGVGGSVAGGAGGPAAGGGLGGTGGVGFSAPSGGTLINYGTITGGAGTAGGSGGTAVTGANLAVINAGTIAGGTSAGGGTANAITFTGGVNSLTLYSTSQINGTVVAFSPADQLILGGPTNGTFAVSAIGTQYLNFGVFQKVDASTWTLTGTTTALTPWQVLGGTLAISSDGNLGAPAGGLLLNGGTLQATASLATARTITLGSSGGTILTDPGVTLTANGPVVGPGGLTKTGLGTLTLAGANTYAGPTLVQAGTLSVTASGTLASSVTTALGATFLNAGTATGNLTNLGTARNSGTLGGTVTNSGGFTNTGTVGGLLTNLAGTSTSSGTLNGGAVVSGGSLALTGGSVVNGPVTNSAVVTAQGQINGPVTNNAGASFTLTGGLTGITQLTNDGTLTLAGNSLGVGGLAGGGLIQNAAAAPATFTVGTGGASGSFGGLIQDGAGGGALSLTKVGGGTLTLTGTQTYSGGTLIKGGTVAIDNPNAVGPGTVSMDEGTRLAFLGSGYTFRNAIRFTGATDPTLDTGPGTIAVAGTISGPGTLEKAGSGTLVVLSDNTYTGNTLVSAGILQVEGSIAPSPLTAVAAGAGLTGTGRIGGLAVQAGGFVAPGNAANPYGTLSAEGPVALGAGSAFLTNVSPTAASRLTTTASATIAGGTLLVTPGATAFTTPVRLPVLVANGGLTGQFAAVAYTAPVRGLQPSVVYDANNAYVQFGDTILNPNAPSPDFQSVINSARALAGDRFGAFVTQRVLGSVLTGFNQQISCGDCVSGFGLAGSYSVGAQGRRAITEELIAIGGFAYSGYDSGRIRVAGAPIFAGLLRYDPAGFGGARPFIDVGGLVAPWQTMTYGRTYAAGTMTGFGAGRMSSTSTSIFGRVGYVARLSPQDEVAAAVEIARGWQTLAGYGESQLVPNPYPLASRGGTDVINIAKLGAQYTRLFGTSVEAQVNLGVAHGFGLKSGLNPTVLGVPFETPVGDTTWAEYGARLSYRVRQDLALDAFILGTLGPRPVGDTIHGGASVRYAF